MAAMRGVIDHILAVQAALTTKRPDTRCVLGLRHCDGQCDWCRWWHGIRLGQKHKVETETWKKRKLERPIQNSNFYCPSPAGHMAEISATWPSGEGQ